MALETSSAFRGDGTGGVGIMTAVPDAREEMIRLLPMLEFGRQLGRGSTPIPFARVGLLGRRRLGPARRLAQPVARRLPR